MRLFQSQKIPKLNLMQAIDRELERLHREAALFPAEPPKWVKDEIAKLNDILLNIAKGLVEGVVNEEPS